MVAFPKPFEFDIILAAVSTPYQQIETWNLEVFDKFDMTNI